MRGQASRTRAVRGNAVGGRPVHRWTVQGRTIRGKADCCQAVRSGAIHRRVSLDQNRRRFKNDLGYFDLPNEDRLYDIPHAPHESALSKEPPRTSTVHRENALRRARREAP